MPLNCLLLESHVTLADQVFYYQDPVYDVYDDDYNLIRGNNDEDFSLLNCPIVLSTKATGHGYNLLDGNISLFWKQNNGNSPTNIPADEIFLLGESSQEEILDEDFSDTAYSGSSDDEFLVMVDEKGEGIMALNLDLDSDFVSSDDEVVHGNWNRIKVVSSRKRMVQGDVPPALVNSRLISLGMGANCADFKNIDVPFDPGGRSGGSRFEDESSLAWGE